MDKTIPEKEKLTLERRCVQQGSKLAIQVVLAFLAIFSVIYYFSVNYLIDVADDVLSADMNDAVIESNRLESLILHHVLTDLSSYMTLLKREHEAVLEGGPEVSPSLRAKISERLSPYGSGLLADTAGSSLFVSLSQPALTQDQFKHIHVTDELAPLYRSLLAINPVVGQVYFMSSDGVSRFYPGYLSIKNVFLADTPPDIRRFTELTAAIDSARKTVWTKVVQDVNGVEQALAVFVPIVSDAELKGIIGIDVPFQLLASYIEKRTPSAANLMIVADSFGNIIVTTKDIYGLLGNNSSGARQQDMADKALTFVALEDSDLGRQIQKRLAENKTSATLKAGKIEFLYSVTDLPDVNLKLISLKESIVISGSVERLGKARDFILAMVSLSMILMISLVLSVIFKRLKYFAAEVSSPLKQLLEHSGALVNDSSSNKKILISSDVKEISALVDDLNVIISKLEHNAKLLQATEASKQMIEKKARIYQVMANTDSLTGLNNRKFVDSLFRHEAIRASRNATPISIMLLDVDRFKAINDNYGHQTGDLVLKRVATTLKTSLRAVDTVGRWGGEEFLLVCPDTALDSAVDLAEKVRHQIELLHFERGIRVTVSVGVAQYIKGERTEKTIARADGCLYLAKMNGRNRVEFSPSGPLED